jgi:hypothetical protein
MSDDFSDPVKRALAARVGYLCSDPGCRAPTSGPQDDPARSVNLGVAAHITAASPGGPRYDPSLLPEQRSGHENGIWLCQNHGKLVDNDRQRFTVDLLRKWKADAEAEARDRVGKTAATSPGSAIHLPRYTRVRVSPIVPREFEQSDFMVEGEKDSQFVFKKLDSSRTVDIPRSFIERVHLFSDPKPGLVQLVGRIQWISSNRNFELFPDKPGADTYGIPKSIDDRYPGRAGIKGKFAREDRLPEVLGRGWRVYYDLDGTYLRWRGPEVDQILVVDWV